jgi:hypothetical protein
MKFGIFLLLFGLCSGQSQAFDLEDYATTYRATRDAYLKALNEAILAKSPFDQMLGVAKLYEKACYRIKTGPNLVNIEGLLSGACNFDGQLPHKGTGGPKEKDGSPKIGDQWATLLNLAPINSKFPYRDFEDIATQYRARRDELIKNDNEKALADAAGFRLELIPNCVVQDELLATHLRRPLAIEDWSTTFRAVRDAYMMAMNQLALATGPYKGAKEAYQAATTVYAVTTDCESTLARSPLSGTDPFDWENEQANNY